MRVAQRRLLSGRGPSGEAEGVSRSLLPPLVGEDRILAFLLWQVPSLHLAEQLKQLRRDRARVRRPKSGLPPQQEEFLPQEQSKLHQPLNYL